MFPMFVSLAGRRCLVVGAGRVAKRKIAALEEFGAEVIVSENYRESDLDGVFLAIAATDDSAVNAKVAADCAARRIPVNVADEPEKCSFYFPAYVKKGAVTVGVSTSGRSPLAASRLRSAIEPLVTDTFAAAVDRLGEMREAVMKTVPDQTERKRIFAENFTRLTT